MALFLLSILIIGCQDTPNVVTNDRDTVAPIDDEPPEIVHEEVSTAQPLGEPVPISAIVTDNVAVFVVKVFYKQETSTTWDSVALTAGESDQYIGEIPAEAVRTAGMHYYLYAMDVNENEAFLPEAGPDDPWHFRITSE